MTAFGELTKGIIKENPVFVMALGLCPLLATSTSVDNAIGMGAAATFVLICSNIIISLIKNFIPDKIRIPCYILVIASFVTIVDMVMHAYVPELHKNLGIFIP
ncbi:MAG: electron transport complex subunit RsxE, partial [Candidatus Cloacimonetes bacterium]|nr:electron transport complex subunit RsxE [Candidatus Cloacimonadota bacterium]